MVGFQTKDNIVASLFGTMMGIETTPKETNLGVAAIGKMAAAMPSRTASVDCDSELHSSKTSTSLGFGIGRFSIKYLRWFSPSRMASGRRNGCLPVTFLYNRSGINRP